MHEDLVDLVAFLSWQGSAGCISMTTSSACVGKGSIHRSGVSMRKAYEIVVVIAAAGIAGLIGGLLGLV